MGLTPAAHAQLADLRARLLRVAAVAALAMLGLYIFKEQALAALLRPLLAVDGAPANLLLTGVGELFFIYLKVCVWGGLFAVMPYLLWEMWRFVTPGLYPHERRRLWPMMWAVPILFYAGGIFAFFVMVPLALGFFMGFAQPQVVVQPLVGDYLGFLSNMAFAFGLAFNLPVILTLLMQVGLVKRATLAGQRRAVIIGIFVISAILTPPDPLSQCLMAIPLVLLFEGALLLAKMRGLK